MDILNEALRKLKRLEDEIERLKTIEHSFQYAKGFITDALLHLPFDGKVPYETNFDVNTYGQYGQQATISGGVIGRPGKFGKAVQVAEATTNLIVNPIFENNVTDGWSFGSGTGGIRSRDTTEKWIGSASCKIVAGSGQTRIYSIIVIPNGESVTFHARMKQGASATNKAFIQLYDITNGSYKNPVYATLYDEWEFLTFTWLNDTGVDATCWFILGNFFFDSTTPIWVDAIQVELKSYSTPLCHGGMGDGHSWSGTAHNSTSSRTATGLKYEREGNIKPDEGSISFWAWTPLPWTELGNRRAQLLRHNHTRGYYLFGDTYDGGLSFYMGGAGSGLTMNDTLWDAGWHHIVAMWSESDDIRALYLDGSLLDSDPYKAPVESTGGLEVGYDSSNGRQWNGYIDDFAILDRALTADEVRAIYESDVPLVVPSGYNYGA